MEVNRPVADKFPERPGFQPEHLAALGASPGPGTFPELVARSADLFGDKVLLRRRDGNGGGTVTFAELHRDVQRLARGLAARGIRHGDRIALIAENSYQWLLSDLAVASLGAVDVPRGVDTSPLELEHILAHSGCRMAIAETAAAAAELLAIGERLRQPLDVLVMGERSSVPGATPLAAVLESGGAAPRDPAPRTPVRPDDLLTIVYTSGTTADPKGVMLTHRNVLTNIFAVNRVLGATRDDVFLSVLPAWHVYERIMDYLCLACGSELVYTSRRRIGEDLRGVRPTVFAAVPRIWESIHDRIVSGIEKLQGPKQKLMRGVLANCRKVGAGRGHGVDRLLNAFYRRTLLRPIHAATGGRLRLAVSGGGALPGHIDEMLLGTGLCLLNGYGLTETSPVVCLRPPDQLRPATIGPAIPETEVEIRDPDGRRLPAGDIGLLWIRGPQVMQGYYRNPETTRRVLTDDGWFNSGDLARIDARGHVYITGRAKDTIVLAGGENVEPEPLETGIKSSPLIDQAVVLGQDQKALGAILIPSPDCLAERVPRDEWGERDGELTGGKVLAAMRAELDRTLARSAGFRPCERVARFKVRTEPMTVENGLLTPTMKVKRHEVQRQMGGMIEALFRDPA